MVILSGFLECSFDIYSMYTANSESASPLGFLWQFVTHSLVSVYGWTQTD